MSEEEKEIHDIQREIYGSISKEGWFSSRWRPAMAWLYFIICGFDFLVAPILMGIYALETQSKLVLWQPLTIQGGGLFHLAMLGILGIYAWGKTQEKIFGVSESRPHQFDTDEERDDYIERKKKKLEELRKRRQNRG